MKDVRQRAKAERAFDRRNEPSRCTVCGRLTMRPGGFCSAACAAKAEAEEKEGQGS
jgi:hypothetical protein